MKSIHFDRSLQFQPVRSKRARRIVLLAVFGIVAGALATPPFGFVLNQILAKGSMPDRISENVQIPKDLDGSVDPWQLQLQAQGDTDFYVQKLVLGPGGYSGWHTHPGILIGTVVSGGVDFYDAKCQKRSINPGEVYIENDQVHGIINTGGANAELFIAYLVKRDAPRRLEASAPACAYLTGIP